jgi:hypothetical protein
MCSGKEKAKERLYEGILKMNESGPQKIILSYKPEIYRGTWRPKARPQDEFN